MEQLAGSHAKLARVDELLEDFAGEQASFLEERPYTMEGGFESDTSEWVVRFRVRESPPIRWGVLIGDVLHNLRSALVPAPTGRDPGFTPEELLWMLTHAPSETMILRPEPRGVVAGLTGAEVQAA